MMPVMMPAVGGMPDAIEMPMQSGSATRNTTTEASRSRPNTDVVAGEVMINTPVSVTGAPLINAAFFGRIGNRGGRYS